MTEAKPIVFVVDDDLSVRRSTERLIRSIGIEAQTFTSAKEFLKSPRQQRPSCLILDVRMPGLSGMDLQRELAKSNIPIPIIFITGHGDISMSVRAMKEGAAEFLTKPFRSRALLDAVRSAINSDRAASKDRQEIETLRERYEKLTPREREVLSLIATGLLNKQIADKLASTDRTIKFHRANIMKKTRAESVANLVHLVERLGIDPPGRKEPACPKCQ